jgi:poly [ADP-ribose] polymerase
MITADANNNKFYRMIPQGDSFTVEYGRIGMNNFQTMTYPISQWNKKYGEKTKKGYVDQSDLIEDLIKVETKKNNEYIPISNSSVAKIVERLQAYAKKAIQENYTVSSQKVTQAMIDKAQLLLNDLISISSVEDFNKTLLDLFGVIPRKMKHVADYLAKEKSDFSEIIQKEQDLLNVMSGQVVQNVKTEEAEETDSYQNNQTILDFLGLKFEETTSEEVAIIKKQLGDCSHKYHKSWKVINNKTQDKFNSFVKNNNIKDVKLLWHGTRSENVWSIVNSGLVLRPTSAVITGKMFGMGIYFAPQARKSLNYTSINGSYWAHGNDQSGFMLLNEVAYGTPYVCYDFNSKYYNFTYDSLQKEQKGANCLHAKSDKGMLRNDEIIVYKEEQVTVKYLVELK